MALRASDVVQGYTTLASSLLERWSTHASAVAANVEAPDYDAESAAADLAACMSLATESGLLLAAKMLDPFGFLGESASEPNIVNSQPFKAPAGATLKLAGPLVESLGGDELPVSVVSIKPPQLSPTQDEFELRADATGHRGATYVGMVEASTGTAPALAAAGAAGATVQVTVWITVP
jgi:hypothetical protein